VLFYQQVNEKIICSKLFQKERFNFSKGVQTLARNFYGLKLELHFYLEFSEHSINLSA